MEREKWNQIKKGMEGAGWKCACELHPAIPEYMQKTIADDQRLKYPKNKFDHQWYHNHNAFLCLFVRPKQEPVQSVEDNTYREPIIKRLDGQTLKGIKKYGTVLPQNKASILDRIEHTQQELTDALVYDEWIREGLIEVAKHMVQLRTFMAGAYLKVSGLRPDNPVRSNHERAIQMMDKILEEMGGVGTSK